MQPVTLNRLKDILDRAITAHEFEVAHGGPVYTDIDELRFAAGVIGGALKDQQLQTVSENARPFKLEPLPDMPPAPIAGGKYRQPPRPVASWSLPVRRIVPWVVLGIVSALVFFEVSDFLAAMVIG